jgi:hypothetical protein
MASEILDLPQPFGPTTAAMPSPWNFNSVRSQNDLNPRICSFFSLSNATLLIARPPTEGDWHQSKTNTQMTPSGKMPRMASKVAATNGFDQSKVC